MSRFTVSACGSEVLVQTLRLGYVLARRFISRIARAVERCSATETRLSRPGGLASAAWRSQWGSTGGARAHGLDFSGAPDALEGARMRGSD